MTGGAALAAAQMIARRGDVAANVDEHLRFVSAAADADVGLLVFPELSLTGYELDLAGELAFSEQDPRLRPLIEASQTHAMTLVAGAPVRVGSKLHIGAFIIGADGSLDLYTKQRLGAFSPEAGRGNVVPPPEASVFVVGDRNPLFTFDGRLAAVAICADIGRPAHAQAAADRGARIYLASMFVIPDDLRSDTAKLHAYATQHSMTVVFANYGAPSGGLPSGGSSAIWSERGELLVQLEPSGRGLAVAVQDDDTWRAWGIDLGGL